MRRRFAFTYGFSGKVQFRWEIWLNMIRVLQFADVINRYDFIDNIVQRADRDRFEVGVCVRTEEQQYRSSGLR